MGAAGLLFWLFATMTLAGGLMAVLLPSIQQAVFSLLMSFVGVAAIYALAGADFLAITQIVVYVGGILVLLSFGILLTGRTALRLGPSCEEVQVAAAGGLEVDRVAVVHESERGGMASQGHCLPLQPPCGASRACAAARRAAPAARPPALKPVCK